MSRVDETDPTQTLMQLASAHFSSQALHAVVSLNVPDILGEATKTVGEIAAEIGESTNEDALLRTLRMVSAVGILEESRNEAQEYAFCLTATGSLLKTGRRSLAPIVRHWMEKPLWNACNELPAYIRGEDDRLPFERAHGVSSDEYYSKNHPESLQTANEFVRLISEMEESAVLDGFDWKSLSGKTVVDVGGYHGKIMGLVASRFPEVRCISLDLPQVVAGVSPPPGVELVGGDVFDPATIPACNAIFMKHFLDKCMWTEEESVKILENCYKVLPPDGRVIIGEAVLPDSATNVESGNGLLFNTDVLFLLVGRDSARMQSEWRELAENAGFVVEKITVTSAPSCYIIVLRKA